MRYAMVENVLIFVIGNFLATTVGITLERISGIALGHREFLLCDTN